MKPATVNTPNKSKATYIYDAVDITRLLSRGLEKGADNLERGRGVLLALREKISRTGGNGLDMSETACVSGSPPQ